MSLAGKVIIRKCADCNNEQRGVSTGGGICRCNKCGSTNLWLKKNGGK